MNVQSENSINVRKNFILAYTHANPNMGPEKISALYDLMEKNWPEITRGGHRGLVGRLQPWEEIVHTCPHCKVVQAKGIDQIKSEFGTRFYKARKKMYFQSWCSACRNPKVDAVEASEEGPEERVQVNPAPLVQA
jgi:hypothetical protein